MPLPIITVTGVLVKNAEGKYLLCLKPEGVGPYPEHWITPGGGLDENESLDDCARREVLEETGILITNLQRVFFDDFITPNWRGNLVHYVAVLYTADYESGEAAPQQDDDKMREVRWFTQAELTTIPLNPPLKRFLQHLNILN